LAATALVPVALSACVRHTNTGPCSRAISYAYASSGHAGIFFGQISQVVYEPLVNGSPTFIDIGSTYQDDPTGSRRVTIVVWGNQRDSYPDLTSLKVGGYACFAGAVADYRGGNQMVNPLMLTTYDPP